MQDQRVSFHLVVEEPLCCIGSYQIGLGRITLKMVATRSRRFDAAPTVPNVDLDEPMPYQGKPECHPFSQTQHSIRNSSVKLRMLGDLLIR